MKKSTKKIILSTGIKALLTILLLTILHIATPAVIPGQEEEECLKKSSSQWGSNCGACYNSSKSYRINLANLCDRSIDVKLAVQEKTLKWRTFNVNNLAPGDTISGYACEGTGKYVSWSRTAGDRTIIFPTDEEIEKEFSRK